MRKLTHAEIAACATGALTTRDTDAGLEFLRFQDGALAYYAKTEAAQCRSLCPAGVVLDFTTDSDVLALSAVIGMAARRYAFFDLYVDGVFAGALGAEDPAETLEGTLALQPAGVRRTVHVELYLPHCRRVGLRDLCLAGDASFAPQPATPRLLAIGDSITQGMHALHPSLMYASVCARALGYTQHNLGVGGHIFDADSLPELPLDTPALITVAYGVNDWNRNLDVQAARPFLARVRAYYPHVPVFVLAPIWSSRFEGEEAEPCDKACALPEYREALRAIVAEFAGMTYLPSDALLPAVPAFLHDGVHPTTLGHTVYGSNLARRLAAHPVQA